MQCRRSCFVPGRYKFCRHRMCLHLISHLEPVRSSSQDYLILFTTRSRCIPKPAKLFFAKRPSMEYAHQLNVNTFFFFRSKGSRNQLLPPSVRPARPSALHQEGAQNVAHPESAGISPRRPEISRRASAHREVESAIIDTFIPMSLLLRQGTPRHAKGTSGRRQQCQLSCTRAIHAGYST